MRTHTHTKRRIGFVCDLNNQTFAGLEGESIHPPELELIVIYTTTRNERAGESKENGNGSVGEKRPKLSRGRCD